MSEDCHDSNNGRTAGYPPEHTCRFSTGQCAACDYYAPQRRETGKGTRVAQRYHYLHDRLPNVEPAALLERMALASGHVLPTDKDEVFLAGCKIKWEGDERS